MGPNDSKGLYLATRGLARELVGDLAPEETDLFDEFATAPTGGTDREQDEPLAFGSGELIVALTPILLKIAQEVVAYLAEKVPELGYDLVEDVLKDRVKRLLEARKPSLPEQTLAVMRAGVTRIVESEALRQGLDAAKATVIAGAVEKRLGIGPG
jgi:hypothetical protein